MGSGLRGYPDSDEEDWEALEEEILNHSSEAEADPIRELERLEVEGGLSGAAGEGASRACCIS